MNHLLKIIEEDNLEEFKKYFDIQHWRDSITQIPNYAGVSDYNKEITYDNCDVIKYALHCNADKIFHFLLPQVDTDKHGENYGWPLLAMAVKNNRYDYANSIISHPKFYAYPIYHTNTFKYFDKREKVEEHIEFLFNYLELFSAWDLKDKYLVYSFVQLICHNEKTYDRFESFYQRKLNKPNISLLEIFKEKQKILAEEIFNRKYIPFIIDKLNEQQLRVVFESIIDQDVFFVPLFESENAKEGLKKLLKYPDLLDRLITKNQVIVSYLPLECIVLLIENNIDIWKENSKNVIPLDYVLNDSDLEDPATLYFMNNYTQQIYDRLLKEGRKSNIKNYCHQKLLAEKLPEKNIISKQNKI